MVVTVMDNDEYDKRKSMVLFVAQITISVSVIVISLVNISLNVEHPIWFVLLGSSLGFLIPGPSFNVLKSVGLSTTGDVNSSGQRAGLGIDVMDSGDKKDKKDKKKDKRNNKTEDDKGLALAV